MKRNFGLFVVLGMASLLAAAGCGGNKDEAKSTTEFPAQFVAARKTFDANCAKCHTIGMGATAGEMKKGPDLGKVAMSPGRTRDWIAAYITDPESKKPGAKMPKFAEKLSADEIGALADYLATMK